MADIRVGTSAFTAAVWASQAKNAPNVSGRNKKRTQEGRGLTERIHQLVNRSVQILVAPAQSVDLIDGVQDGRVMLASELASNFRERSGGELLHQIHGDLPGKYDGLRIRAHLQVLLAQAKLFADLFLDQVDGNALFLRGNDV